MKSLLSKIVILLSILTITGAAQDVQAGDRIESMVYDGLTRTYRIHIAASFSKTLSPSLLLVLHGGGGTGKGMVTLTRAGFDSLSEREGFIVVYPDGIEKHWNDGRSKVRYRTHKEKIDDVGFISALIDTLTAQLNIDTRRVYVTGMSNGGLMSFRLALELSDKIAAIAPVTASLIVEFKDAAPRRPMPVLIMNGTRDPLVPWEGGNIGILLIKVGKVLSTMETVDFWAENNECPSEPTTVLLPDKDPKDGTRVTVETYGWGEDSTEVVLYRIEGGGHTWPGGWQYLSKRVIGKTCRDISACEVIWEFFKKHPMR